MMAEQIKLYKDNFYNNDYNYEQDLEENNVQENNQNDAAPILITHTNSYVRRSATLNKSCVYHANFNEIMCFELEKIQKLQKVPPYKIVWNIKHEKTLFLLYVMLVRILQLSTSTCPSHMCT